MWFFNYLSLVNLRPHFGKGQSMSLSFYWVDATLIDDSFVLFIARNPLLDRNGFYASSSGLMISPFALRYLISSFFAQRFAIII